MESKPIKLEKSKGDAVRNIVMLNIGFGRSEITLPSLPDKAAAKS